MAGGPRSLSSSQYLLRPEIPPQKVRAGPPCRIRSPRLAMGSAEARSAPNPGRKDFHHELVSLSDPPVCTQSSYHAWKGNDHQDDAFTSLLVAAGRPGARFVRSGHRVTEPGGERKFRGRSLRIQQRLQQLTALRIARLSDHRPCRLDNLV